ncbi:MAG: aminotransferase class I/II-fold pyridoxal phosphate-dependent enzyme [Bacilli bacterium]|jgi:cystathionine gamma-synthase/methionine-gamma-lyase|nr:aminotransferase class I/II-fold pyridoxal phosphate-dependent enzyme [Bacilli bacterium]
MKDYSKAGTMTKCIRGGHKDNDVYGSLHTPIYMTSNYALPTDGTPVDWSGVYTNIYARNGNPNQFQLQDKLALLEETEDCVVLASGVAALSAIFTTFLKENDHCVFSKVCYSAVTILFNDLLPTKGIKSTYVDTTDIEQIKKAITLETKLIHIETPGNPTTGITDIKAVCDLAHEKGILVSVDSTFASPYCQKPATLGADLVMHSMTKYINGHGDALGGCICGPKKLIEKLKLEAMVNYGGILSPFNAWLINRGLNTLPLRVKQHSENAQKIAEFLEASPAVRFVWYPGLKSHPQHELATKQMQNGFSGMISFDVKGPEAKKLEMMDHLEMITHAVSLGDGETLIVHYEEGNPKMKYYPEVYQEGFYRFSVGTEDAEDIIADLQQAFEKTGLL